MRKMLEFWLSDRRIGVSISRSALKVVLSECRKAGLHETGGVLWGMYDEAGVVARVTRVSGPPHDSESSFRTFKRGVAGLQKLVEAFWNADSREYYLGEWHFHPFSSPDPSLADEAQMFSHAADKRLKCPEPVLVILGGNPTSEWTISVSVFTRTRERYTLVSATGGLPPMEGFEWRGCRDVMSGREAEARS